MPANSIIIVDINECLGITCLNNGSCVYVAGSYSCQCNQGFSGDVCQSDINECLLSNDTCDDQCINTNGSFYCKCNGDSSSLSGDGVSCKETNSTSHKYQSTHVQIGNSMNEYESVVVKEVVKVDGETVGQISSYDNIQIKGISEHNGHQRPDRETAEYENLVIFRK
ncbi:unnamed protein product [Mytilus coruscus]|uniref:EGF-like domain-containing protein n=1 Tax=Mytilus coruscus TaxID=42192 RepID=A0A6J8ELG9_MYTCO|nr:unnamed protein product [Mytilus coruscus]